VGNGSELRRTVHAARTPSDVLDAVERFFEPACESRSQAAARTAPHPVAGKEPAGHGDIANDCSTCLESAG